MHRPRPKAMEMLKCVLSVVEAKVDSEVILLEIQLTPVAVIGVFDADDGLSKVCQTEEKSLLNFFELAALDVIGLTMFVVSVAEKVVPTTKIRGEVGIDKRHIIVNASDLENFLASEADLFIPRAALLVIVALFPLGTELTAVPSFLDVAEQFDAEFVGVQPSRV